MKYKGFTPVIDAIRDDVGSIGALIYGVMWRFAQMSELRVCSAKQDKIAERADVRRTTVIKYQKILEEKGYITKAGRSGRGITWVCKRNLTGEISIGAEEQMSTKQTSDVNETDISMIKRVVKKEQPTLFNTFYGTKPPKVDSTWFPADVKEYLIAFSINFKIRFKREATKAERGYWIRECREWLKREYSVQNVQNAWQHCVDNDTTISSPRSITWAFDQLSVDDEIYSEEM